MDTFLGLMEELEISTVYWVDDENAEGDELNLEKLSSEFLNQIVIVDDETAKKALGPFFKDHKASAEKIQIILKREGEDEPSKRDRITPILSEINDQNPSTATLLLDGLKRLPGPLGFTEKKALINLFQNPKKWDWKPFSFTKWKTEHTQLLRNYDSKKSLFIIDLQNTSEATTIDGDFVLETLVKANLDRAVCHIIVMTSLCSTEREFRHGRELTSNHFPSLSDAGRIPIFVMSKDRFKRASESEPNVMMAQAYSAVLERVRISLAHQSFATLMKTQFQQCVDEAFNTIGAITIEELMLAVSHTSENEGVSEIETFIRLMNIAQRQAIQKAIVEEENIRNKLIKMRDSRAPIKWNDLHEDKEIEKLRGAELYDDADVVNKLYAPLSPGDLFAIKSNCLNGDMQLLSTEERNNQEDELYVLVANACDLMLRRDGTRNLDGGIFLQLKPQKSVQAKELCFELTNLDFTRITDEALKRIDLRRYSIVSLNVLDLCWTNPEGECIWSPERHDDIKNNLLVSQRNRLQMLNDKYIAMSDHKNNIGLLKIAFYPARDDAGKLIQIEYGARRIGRLSHSYAMHLVSRFVSVFGRPSAAHDFTQS